MVINGMTTVTVEGRTFTYENALEASRQGRLWVSQALHFAKGKSGTFTCNVSYGPLDLTVMDLASGAVCVYDRRRRSFWTVDQIAALKASAPFPKA